MKPAATSVQSQNCVLATQCKPAWTTIQTGPNVPVILQARVLGFYPNNGESADLGGRVGWLPKAERVKTLFLSPVQPQNAEEGGGGGG